jgi:hypothetical protein
VFVALSAIDLRVVMVLPSLVASVPIPVAARSQSLVCGRSIAGIVGSNSVGGMGVSCEYRVLSGRGLCVGLITRPEESHQVWCI